MTFHGRLLVLGLSHRTARVELREKASLAEGAARALLRTLRGDPAIAESAVLPTCNRTELVAVVSDPGRGVAALSQALVDHSGITARELARASYVHADEPAA